MTGKGKNRSNLRRAARRLNITDAFSLTSEEVGARLPQCKLQLKYFKVHGNIYQAQHLNSCLEDTTDKEEEEAKARILQIIHRE